MPERIKGNKGEGDGSKDKKVDAIWIAYALRTLSKVCKKGRNPTYEREQLYLAGGIKDHRVDHLREIVDIAVKALAEPTAAEQTDKKN